MVQACGDSTFALLDDNGTVPLCFLDLFLFSLNNLMLLMFGSLRIREVRKFSAVDITATRLHKTKIILFLTLAILPIFRSIIDILTGYAQTYAITSAFFITCTSLFGLILITLEYSRGFRNSWVIRAWWTLHFMLLSLELQSNIYDEGVREPNLYIAAITFPIAGVLAFIGLFINKIPEGYETLVNTDDNDAGLPSWDNKVSPVVEANIFSRLLFSWLNPLLVLGYKRPLESSDLYDVPPQFHSDHVTSKFEMYWEEEKMKEKPSLARVFRKAFGARFVAAGFLKLIHDCLLFVGPVILQEIIAYVKTPTVPTHIGFLYVLILFLSSIGQSTLLHQYFFITYNVGMQVRSAVVTAVYKKSFKLSSGARQSSTVGEIVNLQAVDSSRMQELFPYLHTVWSAPFQMGVSLFMLWRLLGPSVLAGLAVMVLTIPLNAVIMKKLQNIQKNMMKSKDMRTKIMNEVLNGIRVIKFFAWENSFIRKIGDIRDGELKTLKSTLYLRALASVFWTGTPILVAVVTFAIFSLTGGELTAEKAFTALALFNILRFPLNVLPMIVSGLVEARVSINRLHKFLMNEELDPKAVSHSEDPEYPILIKDGTFKWDPKSTTNSLTDVNLKCPRGELIAVVGPVGSGKSSLLGAILGEIPKVSGTVNVSGTMAYVAQQPWIQNTTLRENILFGKAYNQKKYEEVLRVCELTQDIAILPDGDRTEIGERGINLSGGQKQRVSLARAVYQDCSLYLFDDCLSAVDAHVGRAIFENCINGILRDKTRVLITHQLQFVSNANLIVVLKEGKVSEIGAYNSLMDANGDFANLIKTHVKESHKSEEDSSKPSTSDTSATDKKPATKESTSAGKITSTEERELGNVDIKVYKAYIGALGGFFMILLISLGFLGESAAKLGSDFWLSFWSTHLSEHSIGYYLGIYTGLSMGSCAISYYRSLILNYGGLSAAKKMHDDMLNTVIRAPMSFYDTTPIGRILNRFSKDQYTVDDSLSRTLGSLLGMLFNALSVVVVIGVATPFFLVVFLPLAFIYRMIQKYYLQSSRELKRLDSITRSPIYAQFSETLSGLSTIRTYERQSNFIQQNNNKLDLNTCAYFVLQTANRWLGMRLEFLGASLVTLAAAFCVMERESIGPGLAGLSISYALQMTGILNWLVRMATETETNMVSVERVLQYTALTVEAPPVIPGSRPPRNWPSEGTIQFKDVKMRYREGLDPVLKGISLDIKAKEKIGVVGRTGAGKSSLMLALFRLVELTEGQILIDNLDISKMGLDDLREKLSIIPQEPTLFTGSIRSNLDPFNQHSDAEIWQVLTAIHLRTAVEALESKLEAPVAEFGENFSVGQRQLLCLGRALLRRSRVLVMDEATAAIDFETDALIQKTIREEFKDVTVLTIAHRIHTIMDYDKVLVLDQGKVAEYDSPANLIEMKGIFYSMVQKSGTAQENN